MKINAIGLLMVVCLSSVSPASGAGKVRTIGDIHAIPTRVLKRTISPTLYQGLLVSPVEAWIEVRGQLSGTHIYGARVIHSEDNGAYDQYALQLARDWQISGHYQLDKISPTAPVIFNVLIYEIADGTMAVSFPCFEEAGGEQLEYYGYAKLAVQQIDGKWTDLKMPERPLATGHHSIVSGNGWAVRDGLRNNFELEMLMCKGISSR